MQERGFFVFCSGEICFVLFHGFLFFCFMSSVSGTQNKCPNSHHSHPLHLFNTCIYRECKVQNGLNEFLDSVSFVNEIDDVVYILTVLSFFIFIGCYYLFRTLSLSFYYTHYCKILLYYIIYYIVNTQFSLVVASFLQINYLSISYKKPYIWLSFDFLKQYSTNGTCLTSVICHLPLTSLKELNFP